MVDVIYLPPDAPPTLERHIAVIVHREGTPGGYDKGYFFDSEKGNHGSRGPFDWRMEEAVERARRFAAENGLTKVIVRARLP